MSHVRLTEKVSNDLHRTIIRPPPEFIGINFAANVTKQDRQLILVIIKTVTAYSAARLIDDEKHKPNVKLYSPFVHGSTPIQLTESSYTC